MPYRPHCLAKNERNQALIADYLGGLSRREVADKYGLHLGRVAYLLRRHGGLLPREERIRRCAPMPKSPGRPPVWPDCPPHLASDYQLLRRYMPAGEARRQLDPGMQA